MGSTTYPARTLWILFLIPSFQQSTGRLAVWNSVKVMKSRDTDLIFWLYVEEVKSWTKKGKMREEAADGRDWECWTRSQGRMVGARYWWGLPPPAQRSRKEKERWAWFLESSLWEIQSSTGSQTQVAKKVHAHKGMEFHRTSKKPGCREINLQVMR